jgi:ribulose-5-phosphate 4-epimerase/fuculose-1-phosphate aldolase
MLEQIAAIAWRTLQLNPDAPEIPVHLRDRHFLRKHGPTAYYGQADEAARAE